MEPRPKSELEKAFERYLEYRCEIRRPMRDVSIKPFKKRLWEMSGKDEEVAIQILDQSIANGWQGIFPLINEKKINDREHRDRELAKFRAEELAKLLRYGKSEDNG